MPDTDRHLSEREVAAFIDGTLEPVARATAELHLAGCTECRTEVRESTALAQSLPAPQRRSRPAWIAVGAAAAAVLLIAIVPLARDDGVRNVPVERGVPGDAPAAVQTLWPAEGATVPREKIEFIWRRNDDASYRVTLTDSVGGTIWSATTADTMIALPATIEVPSGVRMHWYVDALRLDGTAAAGGPIGFTAR
jgi:hypothetical protein